MNKDAFYEQCARLLDVPYEYREPLPVPKMPGRDGLLRTTYKNRWNGRSPGNGRFPDRGIVRHFGALIQVALTNPSLFGLFATVDEALEAIELACKAQTMEKAS